MYQYRAGLVQVIDGDTFDLIVDCGFYTTKRLRFRLYGVDTPEMNSKDEAERARAVLAKEFTTKALTASAGSKPYPLTIGTYKADSFGRWLADVTYVENGLSFGLADMLLDAGLAKKWQRP